MALVELTSAQEEALWALKKKGRNHEERRRASVILDLAADMKRRQAARHNGCSLSSVKRALSAFRRQGVEGLPIQRFKPHKKKLEEWVLERLVFAMRQAPRSLRPEEGAFDRNLWTLELLENWLFLDTGLQLSLESVRRALKQKGWSTKAPKLSCTSPDPAYAPKMESIQNLRQQAKKGGRKGPCSFM